MDEGWEEEADSSGSSGGGERRKVLGDSCGRCSKTELVEFEEARKAAAGS